MHSVCICEVRTYMCNICGPGVLLRSSTLHCDLAWHAATAYTATVPPNLALELFALSSPPFLLSSKTIDQGGGCLHFPPACLCIVKEGLLLPHGCIIHGLHLVQFTLLVIQLGLCHTQLPHGYRETALLNRQVGLQWAVHTARFTCSLLQ